MSRLPLEHIRILDLTQAWAGAYALQLLGDFGAEVIKVESRRRPDPWRGAFGPRSLAFYPTVGPGDHPYNRSYLANSVNRNKYGITLDLSSPEGKAMFLDLAKTADVVTENFTPRVLGNLGIGYDVLQQVRPGIILLSMPAFGLSGSYSDFPGIGGTVEPMSGNSWLLGEPGGSAQVSGVMYPDAVAGLNGAAAVLSALRRRDVTGEGTHVEISQLESMTAMLGEFFDDAGLASLGRVGNRDRSLVPNGIFRCAGEEEWVAISVRDDADWDALVWRTGNATLAAPEFRDAGARRRAENEIEEAITAWTTERTATEAEAELLEAGVPAARVRNMADVIACPQMNATGYLQVLEQPDSLPPAPVPGIIARLTETPGNIRLPAACHGEHSREVLSRILDLDEATLDDLDARGIIGAGPPPD
ncbi:MAG TPA: CoA transferase [Tepidiformaceae bacterium]|nr:CoA transferase [Tepidiformaceae bacterium]